MDNFQENNPQDSPIAQENIAHQPLLKWGWLRVFIFFFAYFIGAALVQGIGLGILFGLSKLGIETDDLLSNIMEGHAEDIRVMFFEQFTVLGGALLVTWLFRKYIDRKSFKSLGLEWQGKQKDAFIGFATGVVLIAIGFFVLLGLGYLTITKVEFSPGLLFLYILVMAMVAFNEELIVRGYMLNNLMTSINKYAALVITALIFSVMHLMNPNPTFISFINILLAGILLGVYYIHKQNLWLPIFLHFSWNYFQGPIFGFEVSGFELNAFIWQDVQGSAWITGGDFGFEGSLLLTVLMIGAIAGMEWYYRGVKYQ